MNSRERVIAALKREPADRVPVFMWFHPETAQHLSRLLEIPVAQVDKAMGNDVSQTWVNNNYAMEGITHEKDGEFHIDDWGIKWVYGYGFNQIESFPLAGASHEEMRAYNFPHEHMNQLFNAMDEVSASSAGYFLGCDVSPCAFEMYWRLRSMEQVMLDMVDHPDLASEMIKRCAAFSAMLAEEAFRRYPLDWLWTGDDVASQTGMMMSVRMWRQLVKPALQLVFQVGKVQKTWIAYHCCGALRPIIPDLIEMGMDVLNPVQVNCPGMELADLKNEFGDLITFMGGVDTQGLLPTATANEVRRATENLLSLMTAGGGGYILAASHTIPPETPDENIFALYEVAGISREEIFDRAASIRDEQRLS